jgi:hypothetical protein
MTSNGSLALFGKPCNSIWKVTFKFILSLTKKNHFGINQTRKSSNGLFLWANIETLSGSNYVYSLYQDSAHLFFGSSSFLFEKIQSENSRINWFLISTRLWKYFNKEDNLLWAGQWPPDSLIYHCNLPSKRTIFVFLRIKGCDKKLSTGSSLLFSCEVLVLYLQYSLHINSITFWLCKLVLVNWLDYLTMDRFSRSWLG